MYKTELKKRIRQGILDDGCEGWFLDDRFTANWNDVIEFLDEFIKLKLTTK